MTQENMDNIRENYQHIPDEIVEKSKLLTSFQKKVILDIKHKGINVARFYENIGRSFPSFEIRPNRVIIRLFKGLQHKIFSIKINITGYFFFQFSIGKPC